MSQHTPQPELQQWFTVTEAAEYLRTSRHNLYEYMKTGQLPYYVFPGGKRKSEKQPRRRLKRKDLDTLLIGPISGDYTPHST